MTTNSPHTQSGLSGKASIDTGDPAVPDWWIYRCTDEQHDGISRLPGAPPWRSFTGGPPREDLLDASEFSDSARHRNYSRYVQASRYQAERADIHLVNLSLLLRRPLLVTGSPGVGKSTLAYSIAHELQLGPVLRWPVTSRATLHDGLYQYDAIGRLQEMGLTERVAERHHPRGTRRTSGRKRAMPPDIGRYLRLGPLGTALLPWRTPRVLLIDEIDKSDVDFPGDLLHVFEEGEFTVPELARLHQPKAKVMTADDEGWVELRRGRVQCHEFPIVVMTSNEEREFSPAFLRRCVRLDIKQPNAAKLERLLAAHLPPRESAHPTLRTDMVAQFLRKQDDEGAALANDQLLNAVRIAELLRGGKEEHDLIVEHLLRPLNEE
ncbi:AAA family ATPase [Streptomyces sp. NPDC002088]|uniref:AAA family ATPase n=1 Tax=Streptomyces sp. NPDC002088 TaxID=3154665 RepID=UPI00331C5F67